MTLVVLWRLPKCPLPASARVLSFLSPAAEERIAASAPGRVLLGRERAAAVRLQGIEVYREVVARIGAGDVGDGRSLRQVLARSGESSRWWYHPLSKRDVESDRQFEWILHVLIVRAAANELGVRRVRLVGAAAPVAAVLESILQVERERGAGKAWDRGLGGLLPALAKRVLYPLRFCHHRLALARHYRLPQRPLDLVLSSFWDWAVGWDEKQQRCTDRYFQRLPGLLDGDPFVRCGYFAWFDPGPIRKKRRLAAALAPLRRRDDFILLQVFLRLSDVLRAFADFSPVWILGRALRREGFRQNFVWQEIDWLPVFRLVLWRGCLDLSIPHYELVALATQRAAERFRPRLTLSFQEHLPYGRAHYEGIRRSGVEASNWAIQHAGVCPEKTFYYLHPQYEFAGEPDGCRVPHPDRVFVMGEMGWQCFRASGYAPEQIEMTGSPRYDHIRVPREIEAKSAANPPYRILLACSLELETELAMVEAAACSADARAPNRRRFRNHPINRNEAHPRFRPLRARMEISCGSLAEDIAWADLILFSYSTVADEAYLRGTPCWQWLPLGFDGSALAKAIPIPKFGSVAALRAAFRDLSAGTRPPSTAERNAAADALFAPVDGRAADRIAAEVMGVLQPIS